MTTMSYALDRQAKWFLYGTALLLSLVFFMALPGIAKADVDGDFKFTVITEAGSAEVVNAKVHIACTGGAITEVGTTSATGTLFATSPAGANCGNDEAYTAFAVERGGLVTYTTLPGGTYSTAALNSISVTMLYQLKAVVKDQEATSITATSMDTLTFGGIAASTTSGPSAFFGTTGSSVALLAVEDGYVSATTTNPGLNTITTVSTTQIVITFASTTSVGTAVTESVSVRGLAFSHIVKVLREGDSAPIAGADKVAAGGVTCNEESSNTGTYFCPVLIAIDGGVNDIEIGEDGYVTDFTGDTPNRDGHAAAAATTTVSSIDFSHKITILNRVIGTAVTPAHVSAGANDVSCAIVSNVAYCPVLLADDNGAEGFGMQADGYVSTTAALGSNRAASNTAQGVVALTSSNGIVYGNVVTLLGNSNSIITGATVTAGDSYGTTCTENGTTGVFYCAIPVADTALTAQFVKTGYTTRTNSFSSDRTASTTAQVTMTYNQFHKDASGGSTVTVTKPTITSITLGNGSGTTATKDITITFVGSGIYRYKIATTQAGLTAAEYPQYPGVPVPYTLSVGDGVKTLWFQFMSVSGGESTATSKQITLNTSVATPVTPVVPVVPVVPIEPPKITVPVVLLVDLPRVPTVITPISAKPKAPDFTPVSIATLADGDLFMIEDATTGASVYWFTSGYKRPFSSEKAFMSWFPSFDRVVVKRVKKDEISYLAWGPAMPYKPGSKLIKVPDDVKTYSIQSDGSLCHVKDEKDAAKLFGTKWNKKVDDMSVSQLLGTYKIKDQCVVT